MDIIIFATWQEQKNFNDFLVENAWWMALSVAALIALVVALIFLSGRKKAPGKEKAKHAMDKSVYYLALGGEENIVSHSLNGSRIVLELKDYSLVDKEKLKEAGVDGFIMMSNKLTLVIKGDAKKVNQAIFGD